MITPNVIGGRRMATMVLHPTVSDYLDIVTHGAGLEFRLQEVELVPGSWLVGRSIAESRMRETTGAHIVAVRHRDGRIDANPSASDRAPGGRPARRAGHAAQVAALTESGAPL